MNNTKGTSSSSSNKSGKAASSVFDNGKKPASIKPIVSPGKDKNTSGK